MTALAITGIIAVYAVVAILVYGYLVARRNESPSDASFFASMWPLLGPGFALFLIAARLGEFGVRLFKPRPKRNRKVEIPKAKVVSK